MTIDLHYVIEFGHLMLVHGDDKHPLEDNKLGLFLDQSAGMLLKHGSAVWVSAYADTFRKKMGDFCREFAKDMVYIEIVAGKMTPAALAEINACLSNCMRAATLSQRLAEIAGTGELHAEVE
jgi:hypothetical protein